MIDSFQLGIYERLPLKICFNITLWCQSLQDVFLRIMFDSQDADGEVQISGQSVSFLLISQRKVETLHCMVKGRKFMENQRTSPEKMAEQSFLKDGFVLSMVALRRSHCDVVWASGE